MKKKYLIISLFFILILGITANAVTIYLVDDDTGIKLGRESLCVDGYGNLHAVFIDTNSGWLEHSVSTDDGETWTDYEVVEVNNVNENIMGYVIDLDNDHHVVTTLDDGANTYVYYYGGGNNDDWYDPVTINDYADLGHYPSAGIGLSRNSDIYIFYDEIESDPTEDFWLKCRIHSHGQANTVWGSELNAYVELNGFTNDPDGWGISSDTFSNGDVAVIWILECPTDTAELRISVFDVSEETFNDDMVIDLDYTGEASFNPECDIAIDENDIIHIAYTNEEEGDTDGYIDYVYGTWNGTAFSETGNETMYHIENEDNIHPSISYTDDGKIHIMWYGQNSYVTTNHIMANTGTFNNWEGREFCADLHTDDNRYPSLVYQNFPSWAMLYNGYIGIYENLTNDEIYMTDSGDKIFYGSQPPTEYAECRSVGNVWIITKLFSDNDNNITTDEVGTFYYQIDYVNPFTSVYWRIINTDLDEVYMADTITHNEDVNGFIYFYPTVAGNYSIDMTYDTTDWEGGLECPFVVTSGVGEGAWNIKTDRGTYNPYPPNNLVDIFVKIPVGSTGKVEIRRSGHTTILGDINYIAGTGSHIEYENFMELGTPDVDYILYLYNVTNVSANQKDLEDTYVFHVGSDRYTPTEPYTEEETNFWVGLGIILVFFFIGVGVSTKFDESETQVIIILVLTLIGSIVSFYYGLLPSYAPFLLGLLLVGYIVSNIFGSRS